MTLVSLAAIGFFVGSTRESASFEFENLSLELGIRIFELVGSPVELLLELLVPTSKLADRVLHIEETAVIRPVLDTGY